MFKNLALISLFFSLTVSAFASENLVIYRRATANQTGVADVIVSAVRKANTVTLTTRTGTVIPVTYLKRSRAMILMAQIEAGASIDVSGCAHHDVLVSTEYDPNSECNLSTWTLKYSCGLFSFIDVLGEINSKAYDIRSIKNYPLEASQHSCMHGPKY